MTYTYFVYFKKGKEKKVVRVTANYDASELAVRFAAEKKVSIFKGFKFERMERKK